MTKMLRTFGAIRDGGTLGFPVDDGGGVDKETIVQPFLECLRDFRQEVREQALKLKAVPILEVSHFY